MDRVAATTLEVVRALLFFKVFEIAQYQSVKKGEGGMSSLVSAMTYTVGATHRSTPELLTAAVLYKLLELTQIMVSVGRERPWSFPSVVVGNIITTVDAITPKEMFLMGVGDRRQLDENQPRQQEEQEQQGSESAEVIVCPPNEKFHPDRCFSLSDHELPSITEEASEYVEEENESTHDETETTSEEACCFLPSPDKKKVRFSVADVYIFEMTVGDNPSTYDGPPVQLSWSPNQLWKSMSLEKFSIRTSENKSYPRHVRRIPAERRRCILSLNGCSELEQFKAEKQAHSIYKNRCSTIQNMDKQARQQRRESLKELFFCQARRGESRYQNDLHEPFLSAPEDLDAATTRYGRSLCRPCARRCLEDTSTSSMLMYRCCCMESSSSSGRIKNRSSWQTQMNSDSVDSA